MISLIATYPKITQEEFSTAAKPLFEEGSHLRNIGAAPDMVIRMMYPLAGNEKAIGLDYRKTPSQFEQAEKARTSGKMVLAGPLRLVQGGTGLIARLPVFYEDKAGQKHFWGLISAVIDVDELYSGSGLNDADMPLEIAIRGKDALGPKGEVFFGRPQLFEADPVLADIALPNGSWQMAAVPRGGWPTRAENTWMLRLMFFIISILILVPFFALAKASIALGRVRNQVEAEKKRLSATLENTPNVAVQWYDRDGRVTYWNHASEDIFGWTAAEAVGKTLDQLFCTAEQARQFNAMLEAIASTGQAQSLVDSEVKHRNGSARTISSTLFSIPGKDQPVFVSMGVDITERAKNDQIKNEFISVVSHELRTPLTSICGSLGLIAGGAAGTLPDQAQSLLDIALNNCQRLVNLVNDILDLNKIEAGRMEFRSQPTRVLPLLMQALEVNKSYAESYQVSYKLEAGLAETTINIDPDRMMQVLANLLSNAAKYSPEGGQVTIATKMDKQRVRIEITDHGSGIPADFYGQIFQKFSQADSSDTRKKGGTGLGLVITKAIVEQMGGSIGFDSVPDVRTTFFC